MNIYDRLVNFGIGRIEFTSIKYFFTGRSYDLTSEDIRKALALMSTGRYIGLIRRKTHFTTYLIGLGHWFAMLLRPMPGRKRHFGFWSHAWLHIEDESLREIDLQILEAVGSGVKVSEFWDVLNADAIVLLRPKAYSEDQLDNALKLAKTYIGRPYDTTFDLESMNRISCVEYAYGSLKEENCNGLPQLTAWVNRVKNLTPDMIYECGDFEICLEIRR